MALILTISCGHGCGRALTAERLRIGARTWRGIACETCVVEKVVGECAAKCGLSGELRDKLIAWVLRDDEVKA